MLFEYAYGGSSSAVNNASATALSFSPDLRRQPTYFRGELAAGLAFREGISALHDVVISDQRFKPKDRTKYLEWYEKQQWIDAASVARQSAATVQRIESLRAELTQLERASHDRMRPFLAARQRYFNYLYEKDRDAWFVLDPVITVHPDQLFFECFSQDESSYGCLSVDHDGFRNVGEFSCGTTNIDYSAGLYGEFQKIRSYKTTRFEVDPSGFSVATQNEETYREVKIDLPDSWVRGFLQVNAAMCLDAVGFDLTPMDIHNICFILRRRKEKKGPRSMRFLLKPGEPVRILFEPWNTELVCARSLFRGDTEQEIRIWGRRRLHILERLIPVARRFRVHLLGSGMPSFFVAELDGMAFTLGLSGWTANDWSRAGNFDLMAPRAAVDYVTKQTVFGRLQQCCLATPDELASSLMLDRTVVLGALSAYAQAGRVIYDMNRKVYRLRELSREPLPVEALRFSNPREESAAAFVRDGRVRIGNASSEPGGKHLLSGTVQDGKRTFEPTMTIDGDERLVEAACGCNFYQQNRLRKGPCEHVLALRMAHGRKTILQ
jgi:hypothetical protein